MGVHRRAGTVADAGALLHLTLGLQAAAAPDPDQSSCWSPYSVATALGLAATAAQGSTREELSAVLGELSINELATLCRLAADLDPEEAELRVACTAWLRDDLEVADGFPPALRRWPSGALRQFGEDLSAARERINADVAETTHGLIRDLLGEGVLSSETVAVLVAALYLKAAWVHPFDPNATRPRPFHTPSGPVEVPTMEAVTDLGYSSTDDWQLIHLAARGGVEAVVLLPHDRLSEVEPRLTIADLSDLLTPARSRRLRLRLPRLRMEWSGELSGPLATLGVRQLFDLNHADLTGLTPERPAWVDEIAHRSVLRLDEHGLEGAAAGAAVVSLRAAITPPPQPLLVEVDRPFLLVVHHRATRMPYFLVRVTHPSGDRQQMR